MSQPPRCALVLSWSCSNSATRLQDAAQLVVAGKGGVKIGYTPFSVRDPLNDESQRSLLTFEGATVSCHRFVGEFGIRRFLEAPPREDPDKRAHHFAGKS